MPKLRYNYDPHNARHHPERNKALIRQSLEEVGGGRSILVGGEGHVIAGNGVYEQAQALGLKVREVQASPDELIAVVRPDLVGEAAVRAAILDNATGDSSTWDVEALRQLEVEMPALLAGLDEVQAELAAALTMPEPGGGGDEFDTAPDDGPTRCQAGDLRLIDGGKHRLIIGDCTDPAVVARLMQGEIAHLSNIDPPYEMDAATQAQVCAAATGTVVVWGLAFELFPVAQAWGVAPALDLVWRFPYGRLYSGQRPLCHHRTMWLFNIQYYNQAWRDGDHMPSTLFDAAYVSQYHKHDKPLSVIQVLFEQYSPDNALIYAPFGGGGSDLIAAHRTQRQARLIEIEPRFADVILKRAEAEGLDCLLHSREPERHSEDYDTPLADRAEDHA